MSNNYADMTEEERRSVVVRELGPWMVGGFVDFLFQGILFTQFHAYFKYYRGDKLVLRCLVAGLLIITTLKSVEAFAVVWMENVFYFGDMETAIPLAYTLWYEAGAPIMTALIGLYVQMFFCWRLWILSKNRHLVGLILLLFLFAFTSICIAYHYISLEDEPHLTLWFACHLSTVFAGDFLMTCSMIYYLVSTMKVALPQSVGLFAALIRLTLISAAPAALCALLNLVFSQLPFINGKHNIISTAFNQALSKIYAMSMMYALNARYSIRVQGSSAPGMSINTGDIRMETRRTGMKTRTTTDQGGISISTEIAHHVDKLTMPDVDTDSIAHHHDQKGGNNNNIVSQNV